MSKQNIGTCVIVTNPKGQLLLGKRLNSYLPGHWGIPGGRVELGEAIKSAAARELKEETGLSTLSLIFLTTIREYQQAKDFIHFCFYCSKYQGSPKLLEPEKCASWKWFASDIMPYPIVPGHEAAIRYFLNNKNSHLIDIYKNHQHS